MRILIMGDEILDIIIPLEKSVRRFLSGEIPLNFSVKPAQIPRLELDKVEILAGKPDPRIG